MYSNDIVCKILKYIDNHIRSKITIDEIANTFFFNKYYIMKLFKKEIGISVIDYINRVKIYNSIKQIRECNDSMMKIALSNGYFSLEYFSEMFKKVIGVSPMIYKKYIKYNRISSYELIVVRTNLIQLHLLNEQIERYILNKKPVILPTRKLSIFK